MIFFFHHYELPAILSRGPHNVAEDDILEDPLDILNQPPQNNANTTQQEAGPQQDVPTNASPTVTESQVGGGYLKIRVRFISCDDWQSFPKNRLNFIVSKTFAILPLLFLSYFLSSLLISSFQLILNFRSLPLLSYSHPSTFLCPSLSHPLAFP